MDMTFRPMIMRDEAHGGPIYFDEDMGLDEVWLSLEDATEANLVPWAAERLETTEDVVEHAVGFVARFEGEPTAYVEDDEILVYLDDVACEKCGAYGVENRVKEGSRTLCEACDEAEAYQDDVDEERYQGVL